MYLLSRAISSLFCFHLVYNLEKSQTVEVVNICITSAFTLLHPLLQSFFHKLYEPICSFFLYIFSQLHCIPNPEGGESDGFLFSSFDLIWLWFVVECWLWAVFLLLDAGFSWSIESCRISSNTEEDPSLDLITLADETGSSMEAIELIVWDICLWNLRNSSKNAAGQSACVDFLSLVNVLYFP